MSTSATAWAVENAPEREWDELPFKQVRARVSINPHAPGAFDKYCAVMCMSDHQALAVRDFETLKRSAGRGANGKKEIEIELSRVFDLIDWWTEEGREEKHPKFALGGFECCRDALLKIAKAHDEAHPNEDPAEHSLGGSAERTSFGRMTPRQMARYGM